jgi:3-phosphoinositide dependent protein kinase-1
MSIDYSEYSSPEILQNLQVDEASDLWTLGCIIYEFFTGISPFHRPNDYLMFQSIFSRHITYPANIPTVARFLIESLLNLEPTKRLGAGFGGYSLLRAHPFFNGINFKNLPTKFPPAMDTDGIRNIPNFIDLDIVNY